MSIKDSLKHRKTALEDATALTDTVLAQVLSLKTAEISKNDLVAIAYKVIEAFDPTAAAVYQATQDTEG